MVQKGAAGRLGVLDEELAALLDPDLGVRARDDFGFERELVGPEGVDGGEAHPGAVGEPPDAQRRVGVPQIARDGVEPQRAAGVEVWDQADAE